MRYDVKIYMKNGDAHSVNMAGEGVNTLRNAIFNSHKRKNKTFTWWSKDPGGLEMMVVTEQIEAVTWKPSEEIK